MVYFPPGDYTSGTIHLRSHVRVFVDAGATVYSIKDKNEFDKDALFYGEDLVNITLEGRGTVDGQGAYEWRLNDMEDDFIRPNQVLMEKLGKPLLRSFPKKDQHGKLVLLLRCKDVRIAGLSFIDSPSWTIHPYGCERMVIDGVYIRSSLKNGVWADGIDPDGCNDPWTKLEEEQKDAETAFDKSASYQRAIQSERQIAGVAKLPHVINFVKNIMEIEESVVVFCHHKVIHKLLHESLQEFSPVSIIGGQTDKTRQEQIDKFQKGESKLMIAGLRAGNVGINLTRAKYVIFAELDWSPAIHRQAEDRLHRIGQKNYCFCILPDWQWYSG